MRKVCAILFMLMVFVVLNAQEFNATISVNYQKLMNSNQSFESTDTKVFELMKQSLEDFVNGRKWTNLQIEDVEKIPITIGVNLNKRTSATAYEAQLNIQMRRPVYNSSYSSGLFNYVETNGFSFTYNENQPLEFDPNSYSSNLTSTVAYYLYIMLGIYFDSYSLGGGMPFFEQAAAIAQVASTGSSSSVGWDAGSNAKARYWLVENHTNSAYNTLHAVYYNYYRLGLDRMTVNQDDARAKILQAMEMLNQLNSQKRNLLAVSTFLEMKVDELVLIFTPAPQVEKQRIYDVIYSIAPVQTNKLKEWGITKASNKR